MADNPQKTIKDIIVSEFGVLKDDGLTDASTLIMFATTREDVKDLLDTYDVIITVGIPSVHAYRENQNVPTHHPGVHPVDVLTVDKYISGSLVCTGIKMAYKAREEMRSVIESNAQGSGYILEIDNENPPIEQIEYGGSKIYQTTYMIKWEDNR